MVTIVLLGLMLGMLAHELLSPGGMPVSGTRRRPKPKKPGDGCWHCDEIARRAKYRASKNELMELDQVSHSHYTGGTIVYEAIKVDRDGPFHAMTREFYQGEGMLHAYPVLTHDH